MGHDIRDLIPLDKTPFEFSGDLITKWCREWKKSGFLGRWNLWNGSQGDKILESILPPLATALISLKQLAISRQKNQHDLIMSFYVRGFWERKNGNGDWRRRWTYGSLDILVRFGQIACANCSSLVFTFEY